MRCSGIFFVSRVELFDPKISLAMKLHLGLMPDEVWVGNTILHVHVKGPVIRLSLKKGHIKIINCNFLIMCLWALGWWLLNICFWVSGFFLPQAAGTFTSAYNASLIRSYDDILDNISSKAFQLVDSRPPSVYGGSADGTVSSLLNCLCAMRSLQWCHNELDAVSNHRRFDCLLNRLFRRRSKKTSKLRISGLCEGSPPVTGGFSSQKASNAENVFIWWRHHDFGRYNRLLWKMSPIELQ